jgi:hypothetical protein
MLFSTKRTLEKHTITGLDLRKPGVEDSRKMEFIEFVEFLEFIGLMKQGRVGSCIPFAGDNSINTTNTRNTTNKHAGFGG